MTKKLMVIAILIGAAFAFGAGLGLGSSSAADAHGASFAAVSVSADESESAGERMVRLQREMDAVWDNFGYDAAASAKIVSDRTGDALSAYAVAKRDKCEVMEAHRRGVADRALSESMAAVCAE